MAVALAGFSGLFAALRGARGQGFEASERGALLFMLAASLGAAVLSLLPIPLFLFGLAEPTVWLIACLALAVFLVSITTWAARSVNLVRFPMVFWPLFSMSCVFTLLQLVGVAGLFGLPRAAVFAAGLWYLILTAAAQFFTQAVVATRS